MDYEESYIKNDQDHDYLLENEEVKSLKIKVLSLELELKRKDTDNSDLNSEVVLVMIWMNYVVLFIQFLRS